MTRPDQRLQAALVPACATKGPGLRLAAVHWPCAAGNQNRSRKGAVDVQICDKGSDHSHSDGAQPHDSKVPLHAFRELELLCRGFGHRRARHALRAVPDR